MSLKHLILGLLANEPMSGYDLKQRFDTEVNHFWETTQTQIYRTLHGLHAQGYLTMAVVEQDDNPNKKVYRITEAGYADLQRWLTQPLGIIPHEPFVGQVHFANHVDLDAFIAMLENYQAITHARFQALLALQAVVPALDDAERTRNPNIFRLLSLDYGVEVHRAELAWLDNTLARLRRMAALPDDQP